MSLESLKRSNSLDKLLGAVEKRKRTARKEILQRREVVETRTG